MPSSMLGETLGEDAAGALHACFVVRDALALLRASRMAAAASLKT